MPKEEEQCLVIFQPSGRRGHINRGYTIKKASVDLGVDIEGSCGDMGTCGLCVVRIEEGHFEKYGVESSKENLSKFTEAEKEFLDSKQEADGYRLACQAEIRGDVVVFVPETSRMGKQVVRKAAKELTIELKPAVKKYYVEMPVATLKDTLGDWERLTSILKDKFNLDNLIIDYKVLIELQDIVRKDDWKVTVSIWMNKEVIKVESGKHDRSFGLAVDIGTTTVAGYLSDLSDGGLVTTGSMMNPQVIYGEDVMSRISYTMTNPGSLANMHKAIIDGLNGIIKEVADKAGIKSDDIVDMTVVGNTCMHHLFLNIDPLYIGKAPFPPALHHSIDIKARDLNLNISTGAYVHVLPIEAGFVGADNVGVLISEAPYQQDEMMLIIDIGTNGELILGNSQKLVSSSCATGPALEGAEIKFGMRAAPGAIDKLEIDRSTREVRFKVIGNELWNTEDQNIGAKGICGSAIIDIIPQLFLAGIIDRTGRFQANLDSPRYRETSGEPEFIVAWAKETSIEKDIVICQEDIRNIQLAKGAMYAGAKIMMRELGIEKVDKVVLAGAFGSYIDKISAALLGMFPSCELDKVYSVGNAAGDGARMALLNLDKRREANEMARKVEYLELTLTPDFDKLFGQAMWVPHMKDKFPYLENILAQSVAK